jgi:antitoxin FitA
MPTNLTIENIPNELFERLKIAAQISRRSLNAEAIVCFEKALRKPKIPASERIARAVALRAELDSKKFNADDIDQFKREGRR